MNLEKLVKMLEDIMGLPAAITSYPNHKMCQFRTSTGINVAYFELVSDDGYDWKLHVGSHPNYWDVYFAIFGVNGEKNIDLQVNPYKDTATY